MKTKKKVFIILVMFVLLILLIPIPMRLKDGGSIQYSAILYKVTKYHEIVIQIESGESGYREGWGIEILGMEIFNNARYTSKTRSMDDVFANEPHFSGTVVEAKDTYILVDVDEGEDDYKSSNLIEVSLNVECKDSMTHFQKGDQVMVYYDGTILESYPGRVNKVYAITLSP